LGLPSQAPGFAEGQGLDPPLWPGHQVNGDAIIYYNPKENTAKTLQKSEVKTAQTAKAILEKACRPIPFTLKPLYRMYHKNIGKLKTTAQDYTVSPDCISCGICQAVCPAKIINLEGECLFKCKRVIIDCLLILL